MARNAAARNAPPPGVAVNPAEQRQLQQGSLVTARLAEDLRLLRYGMDVLELTVLLLSYHDALRRNQSEQATAVWTEIEAAVERLEHYVIPIAYEYPGPGLVSQDGLQRSQLGPLVERCRIFRLQAAGSTQDNRKE